MKIGVPKGFLFLSLFFSVCYYTCASGNTDVNFYQGLILKTSLHNNKAAQTHFEKALASKNVYVRQAAAEELARLMYDGIVLSPKTLKLVRTEVSGSWAKAFDIITAGKVFDKEKIFTFLLSTEYGTQVPNEAMLYVMRECKKNHPGFFTDTENAVLEGHFAASRARYTEALGYFRFLQEEGNWPEQVPVLFLQYPDLVSDLGRTFLYTGAGNEVIDLFLKWEKTLQSTTGENDNARFRLLFFAARITRQRGRHEPGILLFERALAIAPSTEQEDACIWYILDSSLGRSPDECIKRLEQFVPVWHNKASYNGILERLSRELVSKKEWKKILRVFTLIQERGAALSVARYAWIVGRVLEEGYFSAADKKQAAEAVNGNEQDLAAAYMRIAYNAGERNIPQTLYYRMQSASVLGEPFLVFPQADEAEGSSSPIMDFLLGFFKNDTVQFALQYIRLHEKELKPAEMRILAGAIYDAGMYVQTIRLVRPYIEREGYTPVRRDMELYFPNPFKEITEKNAAEFGIAPSLLFGLIRQESAFQNAVVSHAGAVGLAQLMPATAEEVVGRIRREGGRGLSLLESGIDLTNPELNVYLGSYYYNHVLERFNNEISLALMAYNAGPNRVHRWRAESNLPMDLFMETISIYETRDYGRKVISTAAVYQELYY